MRVGLLVPANNTTMAEELVALLPAGSTCRRIGIPRGAGMLGPDDLPDYLAQAVALAGEFAADDVDRVVYGCTAAGFLAGPARDTEVAIELALVTGKPVVTTASSMVEALKDIGAQRIALVTPYHDIVNKRLRLFLAQSGVRVAALATLGARTVEELAAITPEAVAALARSTMRPDCDALFIACSQLPTRDILPELERELGRPVWSSISATAWNARRVRAPAHAS